MSAFINPTLAPRIGLSEEQAQLIDIAGAFCRDKSPVASVRNLLADARGYDEAVWRELAELGWLGIGVPENYAGLGLGVGELVPIVEQMGRTLMGLPFIGTMVAAQAILKGGTQAQKEDALPAIAGGAVATVALCEAHADWDLENLSCTAQDTADGLLLSGEKYLVGHADMAKYLVITIAYRGAPALLLVAGDALDAARLTREKIIDETHRAYKLSLDGLVVADACLMDVALARDTLAHIELVGSLLLAADMCGGAYSCIEYTLEYLKTRKQFGKPIGSYQALKHTMVDAHQAYERARSHLYSAAHSFAEQGEGEIAVRMAKAEAGEAYGFAADRSIQFHGGFGFTYDCDAQLYRRRAFYATALHGDARYHRRKLAALML